MGSISKLPSFSPGCQVSTPPPAGSDTTKYFSRWSHMNVTGLPSYVIVPITEEDVVSAIQFASDNGYKLIPASGTHGPFVPIDEQTVYLDMRKFDSIDLDEEAGTVKLGGGVLTGSVLRGLGARGWYTSEYSSLIT
jgi:FAD/FMN-containing dehydrogenase